MNDPITLPAYPDEYLDILALPQLINLLIENNDRVPRNLIDACARRGDDMTAHLRQLHEDEILWKEDEDDTEEISTGKWWLQHHAVMILGQIPNEEAGLLLVKIMRHFSLEDDDMQDWIAGYWPALFKNKPDSILPALRELAEDRQISQYVRSNALDPIIANAARKGGDTLEQALAWLANFASDESDVWEFCLAAASLLLHFPREQYRPLLNMLAAQQGGFMAHFSAQEVRQAYAGKYYPPDWEGFTDPWQFYTPKSITQRQIRWREEAEIREARRLKDDSNMPNALYDPFFDNEPYVRTERKIGRNDPCPCGSGKKYKKCCMVKE